jgi:type I restriction enzyme S subunit
MTELPNGWVDIAIGEISDVIAGGTPKANDASNFALPGKGIAWLTPADLSGYKQKEISKGSRDLSQKGYDSCSAKLMPKGSLLFSSRAPIGYVALAANEISTNQGFKSFVFPAEVDQTYAYFFLKSIRELADSLGTGTTFKELSGTTAKTLPFRLAPTNEQIRIAQKLDELLAQVDTLKARIDAIPVLLKRFRQSVLAAAASGRLTEEWRDMNFSDASSRSEEVVKYKSVEVQEPWSHTIEAPVNWTLHVFKDVIKLIGGSQPPKSEFVYETAPGFVRLIQIRDYKSDNYKVFIKQDATKKFCSTDDVMIGRYGPPIFQILRGLEGAYNVALMKASPLPEVLQNEYMYRYLQNYKILNFVEAGSDRTAGQSGVNKAFLEKYPIFLPPLIEQTEIVHRVEQLFAFADQLEAKVASAKTRIDHLTQSILAKAFRGELVPQDPNDEPASVLLERIKAQRATASKAKRGRKASA